jgi:hypothetical protein
MATELGTLKRTLRTELKLAEGSVARYEVGARGRFLLFVFLSGFPF